MCVLSSDKDEEISKHHFPFKIDSKRNITCDIVFSIHVLPLQFFIDFLNSKQSGISR